MPMVMAELSTLIFDFQSLLIYAKSLEVLPGMRRGRPTWLEALKGRLELSTFEATSKNCYRKWIAERNRI